MSVSKTEKKKCRVIQVMKDAEYVKNYVILLFYINAQAASGGVLDVTFNLAPRAILKKHINL